MSVQGLLPRGARCAPIWGGRSACGAFPRPPGHSRRPGTVARVASGARGSSDFDSLALDDEYYKELGMTPEQAAEQLEDVWNVDPEAYFLDDGAAAQRGSDGEGEAPSVYGPPAILLAGFRDHEPAMARATLDLLEGHGVKVIPVGGGMLWGSVAEALAAPEPDWQAPRSETGARGGDWGSQRTMLFSGLSEEDILAILDVFEEGGLPTLMVAVASPENASRILGEVLAEAIQEQRRLRGVGVQLAPPASEAAPGQQHSEAERISVREVPAAGSSQQQQQQQQPGERAAAPVAPAPQPAAAFSKQQRQQAQPAGSSLQQQRPTEPTSVSQPAAAVSQQPQQQQQAAAAGSSQQQPAEPASQPVAAFSQQPEQQQQPPGPAPAAGPSSAARQPASEPSGPEMQRQEGPSSEEVRQSFEAAVREKGAAVLGNFEHASFASQQRELRAAAAEEMGRRAAASRAAGPAREQLGGFNLIDAAAAGEDVAPLLRPRGEAQQEEEADGRAAARSRMEAVLRDMRASAGGLAPEQQRQLAADLKVLEREQETVEKVLADMGASLDSVPKGDREILKAKLREEAMGPTRDAIGAALACGVTAAELRALVDEAERDMAENKLGWFPSLATLEKKPSPGS